MEYAIAILIVFNAIAYSHLLHVVSFAKRAIAYLTSLVEDPPEKFQSNPTIIPDLANKQLPNIQKLVNIEAQRTFELFLTLAANVMIIYYPKEELFTTFWGWVLFANMVVLNLYMALMYTWMRRNKRIISHMCNSYYNYKPSTDEDYAVLEKEIEKAFIQVVEENQEKEIQKILDKVDDDDENNEQR